MSETYTKEQGMDEDRKVQLCCGVIPAETMDDFEVLVADSARDAGDATWMDRMDQDEPEMPAPLSGEWAGESIPEIFKGILGDAWDELDADEQSHLCDTYEEAFTEGYNDSIGQ